MAAVHRDPHMHPKQQRGERRLLLVFPQQSRNKQTMATGPVCWEAQGGEGPGRARARGLAQGWLGWDDHMAFRGAGSLGRGYTWAAGERGTSQTRALAEGLPSWARLVFRDWALIFLFGQWCSWGCPCLLR